MVTMADNTLRAIEDILVDDKVKSRNGFNIVKETHTYAVDGDLTMYSLNKLKVTHNHPMYVEGKWSTPSELNWESNTEYVGRLHNLVTEDSFVIEGMIASGTAQDGLNVVVDANGLSSILE